MRLVIIDDEGEVHEVVEDLEEFDLRKPAASSCLIHDIIHELKMLGVTKYGE